MSKLKTSILLLFIALFANNALMAQNDPGADDIVVYSVTGGGVFCAGGSGVALGLANSQRNVTYTLYLGNTPLAGSVAGTGSAISFGNKTQAGTYTVKAYLFPDSVLMAGSATVVVNPLPTATITGTTDVCQNAAAPSITFTGANGTAPYTFTYTVNGGAIQTVTTTSGNSVSVTQPTSAASTYVYTLVSVQDASSTACSNTQAGTATITVKPLAFVNTMNVTVCSGTAFNALPVNITNGLIPDGTTYNWSEPTGTGFTGGAASVGASSSITGTLFNNTNADAIATYTVTPTTGSCTGAPFTVVVTVKPLTGPAGSIVGSSIFYLGSTGVAYSVAPIANATSYIWSYSGTGVTINGNGANVTLDFAANATDGVLSVKGTNSCGDGAVSTFSMSANRALNLSSILLEGLFNSTTGTMKAARNATGDNWRAGIADVITVELHDAANYNTKVYTANNVELTTSGLALVAIPKTYNGSYYITIKHRNSLATISAAPVSFAGISANISFAAPANVYGSNLKKIGNSYLIYGGDVNQDGTIDSGDFVPAAAAAYQTGYLVPDVNGSGSVDTQDYLIIVNNASKYVQTRKP